jgi:hypothetical protein
MGVPDRGPGLAGVNIAFVAFAFVAYTLRCVVRLKMVKAFGLDDCLMGLALVCTPRYVTYKSPLTQSRYSSLPTR